MFSANLAELLLAFAQRFLRPFPLRDFGLQNEVVLFEPAGNSRDGKTGPDGDEHGDARRGHRQ